MTTMPVVNFTADLRRLAEKWRKIGNDYYRANQPDVDTTYRLCASDLDQLLSQQERNT